MFSELIDYTVSSSDPNNYNKIYCNLTAPPTKYSIMTITCLTTNCNIVVLNKDDYIIINNNKYHINDNYTNINLEAFVELLRDNTLNGIKMYIDNTGRLCFHADREFVINEMTYNIKLITCTISNYLYNQHSMKTQISIMRKHYRADSIYLLQYYIYVQTLQ